MLKSILKMNKVILSGDEVKSLIIGCELKGENILEKLVKSKNKEDCEKLALEYNICNNLKIILIANELQEQSKFKFTLEECEFLIDSLNMYIDNIKMNFKGIKDDSFDELCIKFAKLKDIEDKINSYIKVITKEINSENVVKGDAIIG